MRLFFLALLPLVLVTCSVQPYLDCSMYVTMDSEFQDALSGCQIGFTTFLSEEITFGKSKKMQYVMVTTTSSSTTTTVLNYIDDGVRVDWGVSALDS